MKVVINEYAEARSRALIRWFPEAVVRRRFEGETTPDSFDLLILSGGPYSAHEKSRTERPFLTEDLMLIRELEAQGDMAPLVLGVCLGAQLMAFAFGGHVEDGDKNIVGWNSLDIVGQHPAFQGIPNPLHCEIHSNHITVLPNNARLLASSSIDSIEAFSIGERFIATAYHPEFIEEDIAWFTQNTDLDLNQFVCQTDLSLADSYAASERFFTNIRSLI